MKCIALIVGVIILVGITGFAMSIAVLKVREAQKQDYYWFFIKIML